MNRVLRALAGALFTLMLGAPVQSQPLAEPPTLSAQELRQLAVELQHGGHVIFFRHLDTRQDQEDRQPLDLNDCRSQRNLSEDGIRRGRAIAASLRALKIPVGEVVASPFCRTVDTAKLLATRTTTSPDLYFAIALTNEEKLLKGAALRKMLTRAPEPGRNTLIVSHTANLQEAVGLWPKPEGVAYVFRVDGGGALRAVARIEPTTWGTAAP